MCGHTICARLLGGCWRQVIRDWYTVSFACDRRLCTSGVRYVPICAGVQYVPVCEGVRFVQDSLTGAHVRGFGTGMQCPSRVTGVYAHPVCGMCRFVRACDLCNIAERVLTSDGPCVRAYDLCNITGRVLTSGGSGPVYSAPRV